jgi:hypothetical protein
MRALWSQLPPDGNTKHDLFKAGSARGGGTSHSGESAARKSGEHVFLEKHAK